MHDPQEPHFNAIKRVLCYLRGTIDLRLQPFSSTTSQLIAYSDTDWASCPATRRSTSGYCVVLGDNLLTWSSKRQDTLSRSSAEAEYCGVANAVAETSWIRNLLRELHTPLFTATLVYCDNVSASTIMIILILKGLGRRLVQKNLSSRGRSQLTMLPKETFIQVLNAHDELKRATSRLQPRENKDDKSIDASSLDEYEQASVKNSSEKFLALSTLTRIKGQLR
nr:ribonuclease H-like domain-containing protein [Tanacetum cinerariifolium]